MSAADEDKRTPEVWLATPEWKGVVVMDPDGWNRQDFDTSWAELLTKAEFERRVSYSTCSFPAGFFQRYLNPPRP